MKALAGLAADPMALGRMNHSITNCIHGVLVLVAAAACSNPAPPASREFSEWVQTSDSAQISIDQLSACSAATSIVATYASSELSLVFDAKMLPDGGIAVADALENSVLVFSDGAPLLVGRRGKGPGEFESLRNLYLVADTLLAWDQSSRRVTGYSLRGDLLWTQQLQGEGSFRGRTVSGYYPRLASSSSSAGLEGAFRDTTDLLIARTDGAPLLVGRFASAHLFAAREGRGWRSHEQIFSPNIHLAVTGGTAWIGESATGELASLGAQGEPTRLLQLALTRRRATTEMVEAERQSMASAGAATAVERMAEQIPAFELLPTFEVLRGSSDGRLIVIEYSAEIDDEFRTWLIDPGSLKVACFTMPAGYRVLDARGDLVLVTTRDDMDVPRLELRSFDGNP